MYFVVYSLLYTIVFIIIVSASDIVAWIKEKISKSKPEEPGESEELNAEVSLIQSLKLDLFDFERNIMKQTFSRGS